MNTFYRNIKNRKLYKIIDSNVTNATNGTEYCNQRMILYKDEFGHKYVREAEEFLIKFDETDKTKWG
jgi:hypothetical protein